MCTEALSSGNKKIGAYCGCNDFMLNSALARLMVSTGTAEAKVGKTIRNWKKTLASTFRRK